MEVSAHKDAVDLFERYAKGGDNADLKNWAGKTLPVLKHHLEMAQNLDKKARTYGRRGQEIAAERGAAVPRLPPPLWLPLARLDGRTAGDFVARTIDSVDLVKVGLATTGRLLSSLLARAAATSMPLLALENTFPLASALMSAVCCSPHFGRLQGKQQWLKIFDHFQHDAKRLP
ncbi:DUF4142 domain-containing protein [Bradyrhizobium sp. Pear77]|nr:DUF4142 domain-containing protein [Bradyrhizobium altum]